MVRFQPPQAKSVDGSFLLLHPPPHSHHKEPFFLSNALYNSFIFFLCLLNNSFSILNSLRCICHVFSSANTNSWSFSFSRKRNPTEHVPSTSNVRNCALLTGALQYLNRCRTDGCASLSFVCLEALTQPLPGNWTRHCVFISRLQVLAGKIGPFSVPFFAFGGAPNQKRNFAAELYQEQKRALTLPFSGIILRHTSQSLTFTP